MLKKNKYYSIYYVFFVGVFFVLGSIFLDLLPASASESIGSIDDLYKYAEGTDDKDVEINFKFFQGNFGVIVTDTELKGFAWGNKIGWVNLAPSGGGVLNNNEGKLGGYATTEWGGWLDFNGVTINSSGDFLGYATSQNFGKISFNCTNDNSCGVKDFKVKTDWRFVSVRNNTIPNPTDIVPNLPPPSNINTPPVQSPIPNIIPPTKPLPIGDLSQYDKGGDVIKNNKIDDLNGSENKGQTTRILTSEEQDIKVGDDSVEEKDIMENSLASVFAQGSIVKNVAREIKSISETTKKIRKETDIAIKIPSVNFSTKVVSTIGIVGGGTLMSTSFLGSLMSVSEFLLIFFRMWSILLSFLGFKKHREPWGTVYDSITKQPLDPAYVVLQDKKGNEVATSITDLDGRFGFLVPPGKYRLVAKKTNYVFPSSKLFNKYRDELYENLYFGELIEVEENKIIAKNIPMDQKGFDWNEFTKRDKKLLKFHSPLAHVFSQISNVLFYFGFLLTIALIVFKPDIFNIIIIAIYIILFFIRKTGVKTKAYGVLKYRYTDLPISFAIVRVFTKNDDKEVFHRVADQFGHYYCLLPKGEYYITVEKKNPDESYSKIFTSEEIFAKRGIINTDFFI